MARLIVKDLEVRYREVEVDPVCGSCGADLTEPRAVVFYDGAGRTQDGGLRTVRAAHAAHDFAADQADDAADAGLEVTWVEQYECAGCGAVLAEGRCLDAG